MFRFKFSKLVPILGALIALVAFSTGALATTVTGSVTFTGSPPPSDLTNGSVEDANIQIFTESTGVVLAAPLTVGATTIPAGRYNSFLVHYDPSGDSGTASGTIEFDSNISFVLKTTAELEDSDSVFGTGATYQTNARQTESNDTATAVNRTLTLTMSTCCENIDEARVLTMAPRIAGIGGNYGNQAANAIPSDIPGATVTRVSTATYNSMTPAELRAAYDVLIFTWASGSNVDVDWTTRIQPYIDLGGGIIFEDETNIGELAPNIVGTSAGSGSDIWLSSLYAGLTDGVTSEFVNTHMYYTSWHSSFTPYLEANYGGTTRVVGLYGGSDLGCMIVQGPDMDFHGWRGGSGAAGNQYQLLLNEVKFVTSGCSVADDPNVSDTVDPDVTAPADITVEGDTTGGALATNPAIVGFLNGATATDDVTSPLTITNDSLSSFPVGVATVVTFSAADDAGNVGTDSATVTVVDTTAPIVTPPAGITVEGDVSGGASASGAVIAAFLAGATATDIVDSSLTITNDAPAVFPVGDTTVTFSSTDDTGALPNTGTATAIVTVTDTQAPTITVSLSQDTIWPPNHKMVDITVSVDTSDVVGPVIVVLTSVTSSEEDNAKGNGDGNTVDDVQGVEVGTADIEFQVRAERAGKGPGRIYTVTYTATDGAGNSTDGVATIVVPHSKGK